MPEAGLARELGIEYASVCVVVNHAAGRGGSGARIALDDIARVLQQSTDKVQRILEQLVITHGS